MPTTLATKPEIWRFLVTLSRDEFTNLRLANGPRVPSTRNDSPFEVLVMSERKILVVRRVNQERQLQLCGATAAVAPGEAGRAVVADF